LANDPECPVNKGKDKMQGETMKTTASMLVQGEDDDVDTQHDGLSFGFHMNTIHHITNTQKIIMNNGGLVDENWILLDNQSTVNIFKNRRFLNNIKKVDKPIRCYCNSSYQDSNLQGDIVGFPAKVWYNPGSLANILSFSAVSKYNRITIGTDQEQAFIVWRKDGTKMKFVLSKLGLYYHDVRWNTTPSAMNMTRDTTKQEHVNLLNTVEENKSHYTQRQVQHADLAKQVYTLVGHPSEKDFLHMIEHNMIKNCPINVVDAKRAIVIYGHDVFVIKGKTTRGKAPVVNSTVIIKLPPDILEKHKDVTLFADIAFVNNIIIFVTISQHILFMTLEEIPNCKHKNILPCVDRVRKLYKCRGFRVRHIMTDNKFACMQSQLQGMRIRLNTASRDKHVPQIERGICVIKERARCEMASLPYKALPRIIQRELVKKAVTWINMFPCKGSISNTLSPRTIVDGTTPDFNIHCRVPFGSYCQVH
jgi:hypothetical protein